MTALRDNPVRTTWPQFWTVGKTDRWNAMVAAGDYNRCHPGDAITPDEVLS